VDVTHKFLQVVWSVGPGLAKAKNGGSATPLIEALEAKFRARTVQPGPLARGRAAAANPAAQNVHVALHGF